MSKRVDGGPGGSSKAVIVCTMVVLGLFMLTMVCVLAAIGRIDAIYEDSRARVGRVIRVMIEGRERRDWIDGEMGEIFAFVKRLEKVNSWFGPGGSGFGYDGLQASYRALLSASPEEGLGAGKLRTDFVAALDFSDQRIAAYQHALKGSFDSLLIAVALCFCFLIVAMAALAIRLRLIKLDATWSQRSLQRALEAEEDARRKIARYLHDEAAQGIAAAKFLCESAASSRDLESARGKASEASAMLADSGLKIRYIMLDLRPPELEQSGLKGALESLCSRSKDRWGREIGFFADPSLPPISGQASIQAYRIAQEALENARKHAPGNKIAVSFRMSDDASSLVLKVEDWFEERRGPPRNEEPPPRLDPSISSGQGLSIMRERAALFGGSVHFKDSGIGFSVRVVIPLARREEGEGR